MAGETSPFLKRLRLILWSLVLVAAIGATIIFVTRGPQERSVGFGGEFQLESTNGTMFSDADLAGTPSLVFFGFTFCPDVCPTTLAESTAWRQSLGLTEDELRIIFVSVDPERDTLDVLDQYLSAFGSPVIGLTGSVAEVERAKTAFGVFSEKGDEQGASDYLVNHTATLFMIDAAGEFFGTIAYGEDSETAKGKISRMVGTP